MKDMREQGRIELLYKINQTVRHLSEEIEELGDRVAQLKAQLDETMDKHNRRLQERDLLLSTRDSLYDEDGVWK